MLKISAIFGSPRRQGNTSRLLYEAIKGAESQGANITKIVLRDLKISPCLEIYGCKESGRCIIKDEFQSVIQKVLDSDGIMLASPIFFYTVSAHTKIFMDRCQSLWVKKYWIDGVHPRDWKAKRKALFICAGATHGRKLFDGALLTVKYFFDVLDAGLLKPLLFRGLDFEKDVLKHPDMLTAAFQAGVDLVQAIKTKK